MENILEIEKNNKTCQLVENMMPIFNNTVFPIIIVNLILILFPILFSQKCGHTYQFYFSIFLHPKRHRSLRMIHAYYNNHPLQYDGGYPIGKGRPSNDPLSSALLKAHTAKGFWGGPTEDAERGSSSETR